MGLLSIGCDQHQRGWWYKEMQYYFFAMSHAFKQVALSKTCNLCAPFFLSAATNQLVRGDFHDAAISMAYFSALKFFASFFKELQSMIFIKVQHQAAIQLQELAFTHIQNLSLNWVIYYFNTFLHFPVELQVLMIKLWKQLSLNILKIYSLISLLLNIHSIVSIMLL